MVLLKQFWKEAGGVLLICLLFSFLRFPSLFEPYWYGDEGIYFTVGKALSQGRELYAQIWDNKPPLLYLLYMLFNDLFSIRLVSLIFGLASIVTFYSLSERFFQKPSVVFLTTLIFGIFFGLPVIEGNIANAENFMLFPIIAAALLYTHGVPGEFYEKKGTTRREIAPRLLLLSGGLLGIAFLLKTVAVFDFLAFFTFSLFLSSEKTGTIRHRLTVWVKDHRHFMLGFLLPLGITCIVFLVKGILPEFLETILLRNVSYVGVKNVFIIPQGLLVIKLLILGTVLSLLYLFRKSIDHRMLFILIWIAFSLFNAYFSHRPYSHYQLVLLPSLALGFGVFLSAPRQVKNGIVGIIVLSIVLLLYNRFPHWNAKKTLAYYQNFSSFLSGDRSITAYRSFFDGNTPRDYALAEYLSLHVKPNESLFIWGNSAQIYRLSSTLPTGRYTVAYHMTTPKTIAETAAILEQNPPRYIIILPTAEPFPFTIPSYTYTLTIAESAIYEKNN